MEEFTGMDMNGAEFGEAPDSFDPSSDRTGARVHPGGWGSRGDAGSMGSMKVDIFGVEIKARPLEGRKLSGKELEALLSTAFGEHAPEIARRVGGAEVPLGAPTRDVPGFDPSLPNLPSRPQSRREQLATLLAAAFGKHVDEVLAAMPELDEEGAIVHDPVTEETGPHGSLSADRQSARREAMAKLVAMALGEPETANAARRAASPQAAPKISPQAAAPKAVAPKVTAPKVVASQAAAPKGTAQSSPQVAAPKSLPPKTRPATAVVSKGNAPRMTKPGPAPDRQAALRKLVDAARNPAEVTDRRKAALKAMVDAARQPAEATERRNAPLAKPAASTSAVSKPQVVPPPRRVVQPAAPAAPKAAPQAAPKAAPKAPTQVISKPAPQIDLAAQPPATVSAVRAESAAAQPAPKTAPVAVSAPAEDPAPEGVQCASTPARTPGGSGRPHVPSGRGGGDVPNRPNAHKTVAKPAAPLPASEPRPANDPAAQESSSGIGWGLFMAMVIGAALYGWIRKDTGYLTAETGLGYYLGIAGAAMMALLLLYPMRKKLGFMRRMGPVKYWFQTHMVMGVVGPLLVVFHSNFELGSLNSRIALFTMLVVAFSGLFGRFMYTKIHHGLYGRRATAAEMRMGLKTAHGTLEGDIEFPEEMNERLVRLEKWLNAPTGVIGRTWRLLTVRPRTLWTRFRTRRPARQALRRRAEQDGWDRARLVHHRKALRRHFKEYYRSVHSVAEFGFYERIFGLWHLLHFPLFLMMVFTAVIHVLAVHMY